MPNTTTTTGTIPSYIGDPTKSALTDIQKWLKSPGNYTYGTKPGESLYTPLAPDQNKSIGNVEWLANQDLSKLLGLDRAGDLYQQFTDFKPGKLTDEDGYLGSISSDMNPFLQQVLDPQLREIDNSLQRSRRDQAGSELMAGSFGDSRSGVAEGQIYDAAQRNIADVTGATMKGGWDEAMRLRAGDRDAAVDANRNKMLGAEGIKGLGDTFLTDFLKVNDSLFNAGEVKRGESEDKRKAMEDFQRAIASHDYDSAMKLLGAISGSPYTPSSTTETKSNDGMSGIIGAILGALA